jgi:hypothetical protein
VYKEPKSFELDLNQTRAFCSLVEDRAHRVRTLADIDTVVAQAVFTLKDDPYITSFVKEISAPLEDPETAIAAVDIPENLDADRNRDALLGCLIATALVLAVSPPIPDKRTGSPFTLYNASRHNESQLKQAGLRYYSPEDRIGFHSDGMVRDRAVLIPDHVAIYNLLVAYRRPGNFYFLPLALWKDRDLYSARLGIGRDYRFSMTPIVYADKSGRIESSMGRHLNAPIFSVGPDGRERLFFNGEVDAPTETVRRTLQEMTSSMLDNPHRISIPIRNRRLFIMANDKGLHARDIFAEPIESAPFTRSFLRFVSAQGSCISADGVEQDGPLRATS